MIFAIKIGKILRNLNLNYTYKTRTKRQENNIVIFTLRCIQKIPWWNKATNCKNEKISVKGATEHWRRKITQHFLDHSFLINKLCGSKVLHPPPLFNFFPSKEWFFKPFFPWRICNLKKSKNSNHKHKPFFTGRICVSKNFIYITNFFRWKDLFEFCIWKQFFFFLFSPSGFVLLLLWSTILGPILIQSLIFGLIPSLYIILKSAVLYLIKTVFFFFCFFCKSTKHLFANY